MSQHDHTFDEPQGGPAAWTGGGAGALPPPPPPSPPPTPGRRWRLVLACALTAVVTGTAVGVVALVGGHGRAASATAAAPVASRVAAPAQASTSAVQAALAAIGPSVVSIDTTVSGGGFGGFGGGSGAGTGIVVGASGEVVTNAHVVADASSIRVTVPGRSGSVTATVVGADSVADLAVIKLQGVSGLPAAKFAATSTVHVGDPVLAVGNAEGYGGAPTVTEGIVSALDRELPNGSSTLRGLLQTDAAINPGNSGGALVDTAGRVVGITTAVASGDRGQPAQNIGFAIPSDTVLKALPALRAGKSNAAPATRTAYLGVGLAAAGQSGGALIGSVEPGSPAATAGLQPGDVVTAADGTKVAGPDDLRGVLARHRPGDRIVISWQRNGQTQSARVTLAARPATTG